MYQGKYMSDQAEQPQRPRRRRRRRITVGTICFYSVWAALIVAFFIGMAIAKSALRDWLVDYEASQPDNQSVMVFQQYFQKPDWAELYELAGLQNTDYEDAQAYADYMNGVVGDRETVMLETSAGLSGGKKYVIRTTLGEEKFYNFATFTLVDKKAEGELISDWQIGQVELFAWDEENGKTVPLQRTLGYTFLVHPDTTVTVNGVALGEDSVYRKVGTVAESYLPEGLHGYRLVELRVDGLLSQPQIVATDAQGNPAELIYDRENQIYSQEISLPTITQVEEDAVVNAAQTYCKYMISAAGAWDLRGCFDHNKPIYTTITTNTTWMQGYSGYEFGDVQVSGFYRYSDSLYSAKVTLTLNVVRKDGTVKVYELDTHFFLELQEEVWKVIEMTNVDVQEQTTSVRVEYVYGEQVLSVAMVDTGSRKLTPPAAPEVDGMSFRGWFVEAGRLEMNEDGMITLPSDFDLQPMTVYALFGEAG